MPSNSWYESNVNPWILLKVLLKDFQGSAFRMADDDSLNFVYPYNLEYYVIYVFIQLRQGFKSEKIAPIWMKWMILLGGHSLEPRLF